MSETITWLTTSSNWSGPDGIPARLLEHIWYSALGVVIAALIALPAGLLIGHTGRGSLFASSSRTSGGRCPHSASSRSSSGCSRCPSGL